MRKSVTFGIATKNRTPDLLLTLAKMKANGYSDWPFVIVDDGSFPVIPISSIEGFSNARIIRHDVSAGYVVRRHEIALMVDTPYYFSLDDDSFIEQGCIEGMIEFARNLPDWIAIGFPIKLPDGGFQVKSSMPGPYKCRIFVGCAHLINIVSYVRVCGYEKNIIHQGEEMDLAARAYIMGLDVWHYPSLLVHHSITNVSRNYKKMAYFGARNKIIFIRVFYSGYEVWIRLGLAIVERMILFIKDREFNHLVGASSGSFLELKSWLRPLFHERNISGWRYLPLL